MASKKRGGLSKREQEAKKKGGTLNYHTGVITVPNKNKNNNNSSKSSSPQSSSGTDYGSIFDSAPQGAVGSVSGGGYLMNDGTIAYPETSSNQSGNPFSSNGHTYYTTTPTSSNSNSKKSKDSKNSSNNSSNSHPSSSNPLPTISSPNNNNHPSSTNPISSTFGNTSSSKNSRQQSTYPSNFSYGGSSSPSNMSSQPIRQEAPSPFSFYDGTFYDLPKIQSESDFVNGITHKNDFLNRYNQDNSLMVDPQVENMEINPNDSPFGTQDDPINARDNGYGYTDAYGNDINSNDSGDYGGYGSYGSSKSSNGKKDDIKNPYDDYQKKIDEIMSMQEDAFNKMLDELGPTYEGYKTDFENEANAAMDKETQAMIARQMSYGTADSEQRDQAQERINSDFENKKADFVRKLINDENANRADLEGKKAGALSSIGMQSANNMLDAYKYQQDLRQQEFENWLAERKLNASSNEYGSKQNSKILSWLDDEAQKWVEAGGAPNGRESIASRASQLFGGTMNDYLGYFPDNWEYSYSVKPQIHYVPDPLGLNPPQQFDQFGNRLR